MNDGRFKPGNKIGKGRPPVILPEVQRAVEANRNALKVLILSEIEPHIKTWIQQIIEKGSLDGDVQKLRMLLEMALGKLPEDRPEFEVSEQERRLVLEWRHRRSLTGGDGSVPEGSDSDPSGA
jgi:hypothetical protein